MMVFLHEMRQNAKMLAVWSVVIGGMVVLCVAMFPDISAQSEDFTAMFSSLGVFTEVFGMDQLSIGEPLGFFGVECGAVLGIGGAFFAAYLGVRMLSKEESEHTAEFLLTHPVSRAGVVAAKLAAVVVCIVLLNAFVAACSVASFAAIDEAIDWEPFWLFLGAQALMQLELACVCFGASAVLGRGSVGVGLGFAALLYFANIVANLSENAEWLRFVTPFAYTDAADIITDVALDPLLVGLGMAYAVVGLAVAFVVYARKDVRA